jgi:hypothetical protein
MSLLPEMFDEFPDRGEDFERWRVAVEIINDVLSVYPGYPQ